jgi:hypothetical protein
MRLIQIILLLTVISCSSLRDRKVVEIIDPIEFLNFVLTDTTELKLITNGYKSISDISILPPPTMPAGKFSDFLITILAETDTLFIQDQLRESNNFNTENLENYGFKIIKISEIPSETGIDWDYFSDNYGQGILTVDRPIFNKSYTKAYIRFGYLCGTHCGNGQELVIEKIGNKWSIKEITGAWIALKQRKPMHNMV